MFLNKFNQKNIYFLLLCGRVGQSSNVPQNSALKLCLLITFHHLCKCIEHSNKNRWRKTSHKWRPWL